jgi:putative addiction module CopG family antidote
MKEGDHFDSFISSQIQSGRYGSASEEIPSAFRLLETQETKMKSEMATERFREEAMLFFINKLVAKTSK